MNANERKESAKEFFLELVSPRKLFFHLVKVGIKYKQYLIVGIVHYLNQEMELQDVTNKVCDLTGFKYNDKSGYLWTSGNNEVDILYYMNKELRLDRTTGFFQKA